MRGLFRKVPDRGNAAELQAALEAVDARLAALAAGAAAADERRGALALAAAAGEKNAQAELTRLKAEAAERSGESEDLARARRRLAEDLAASQSAAVGRAVAAAWGAIEGQLVERRDCARELERCLAEAGRLWQRYDSLGQAAHAAVPAAARSREGRASGYPYLQPPARGTTVGDYSLAQALAAAGLGIAWGTHLPSAHDLASWRGLAAETEDYARRLLALR